MRRGFTYGFLTIKRLGGGKMNDLAKKLLALVDKDRIKGTLFDLVRVPSPTGEVGAFANHFAAELKDAGVTDVKLVETKGWPNSPSVVGRRRGVSSRPTLHFDAHMDHIRHDHVQPYMEGDRIVGRGAADMKFGLAAIIELIRVLRAIELPGDLLVTGHDLHEAPIGHGEGVRTLIREGYLGDAVIVVEGPKDEIYLNGKSNSIFEIDLKLRGGSVHELNATRDMPNLIEIGADTARALKGLQNRLSQRCEDVLGPETLFLGMLRAGDFYNRLPKSCNIVGTRRFPPETERTDVEQELRDAVVSVTCGLPIEVRVDASRGDDGFRLSADEPIVKTVRSAYQEVTGRPLPIGIQLFAADNAKFINWGHVPCVGYGIGLERAHADLEWCDINDVVHVVRVLLVTTLNFFGLT